MKTRLRLSKASNRALLLSLGTVASVACSFSTDGITFVKDSDFYAGAAGKDSGNAGVGGKGSAGAHSGGANAGGNSDAGSDTGGDAGAAESGGSGGLVGAAGKGGAPSMGGSLGTAGSVGTAGAIGNAGSPHGGGSGGAPPMNQYPCKGAVQLTDKTFADFTGVDMLNQQWKNASGAVLSAVAFPDPANGKPSVKFDGALNVYSKGTNQPTGVGVRVEPCMDWANASTIQFSINGNFLGGAPKMAMRIFSNENWLVNDITKEGMCLAQGPDPMLGCQPPHVDFVLPSGQTTLKFNLGDFVGGRPMERLAIDQIKRLEWVLIWTLDLKPFDVNFTIDDVIVY